MISILLVSQSIDEARFVSEFCKREKYIFFFIRDIEKAEHFLLNESITVAIVNSDTVDDASNFITFLREKGCNTSLIYLADRSFDQARKLLKMGYYDYLPLDYKSENLFASIDEAVENIFAFEKIKGLTEELENTNKSLMQKTEALENETLQLQGYVEMMTTVDIFVKEVNTEKDLLGVVNVVLCYLKKQFNDHIILFTIIKEMKEHVAGSYGVDIDSVNNMNWDLRDLNKTPWASSILELKSTVTVEYPLEDAWYSKSDIITIFPYGFVKVPLYTRKNVLGTIMLSMIPDLGGLKTEDEIFLNLITEHAAIAMENMNLNKKLENTVVQLKEAQLQITESEQMATMAKFAVSVNHEINNPLCAISLNVELLKRKNGSLETKPIIEAIEKNIDSINSITNKISNMKRIVTKEYLPGIDMIDFGNSD